MTPYYEADGITLFHGDALATMAGLEDATFDLLLTDPPYSSGGMFRADRADDPKSKYIQTGSESHFTLGTFNGDSRSELGHLFWCATWLMEATRLVKPGGVCALFTDWRQLPASIMALQSGGWIWRGIVPWHKPSARPVQGRWTNACEYVVWGTNGARALEGSPFPGFYSYNAPREREHITQKPVELMRSLLAALPEGGQVLDPFMGSGTTLRAAKDMGRRGTGIETVERYCEIAANRLGQGVLAL